MSTKVKSILFWIVLCLFIVTTVLQSERKKQIENKEQEIKVENEIVKKEEKEEEEVEESKKEVEKEEVVEKREIAQKPIVENPQLMSLGKFKLTAYCPCSICCGKWSGSPTASGVMPKANHTIAVDTSIIPFGTEVVINDVTYIAEDTGSSIKGNKIDVYMDSHEAALQFGVQYAEVFIKKN